MTNISQNLNSKQKSTLWFFILTCLCLISAKAQGSIEGEWKNDKNGTTILIYEEEGSYFGQLIGSEDPEQDQKIKEQDKIILLRDFKNEGDSQFCCGTIYQPKKKRSLDGSIELEDENTMILTGKYKKFSRSQSWTRI